MVTIIQCQLIYPPGNDHKNPSWEKENHVQKCVARGCLGSQQGKSNIPLFFLNIRVLAAKTKAAAVFPKVFRVPSHPSSSVRTVKKNIQGLEGSTEPSGACWHKWAILVGVDRDPYDGLLYIIPIYK